MSFTFPALEVDEVQLELQSSAKFHRYEDCCGLRSNAKGKAMAMRSGVQRRHAQRSSRHSLPRPQRPPRLAASSSILHQPPRLLFLLLALFILSILLYTLRYQIFFRDDARLSVYDRGLVTKKAAYKNIISEADDVHVERRNVRHFNASVLAYVTPWNAKGYDAAKKYRNKFSHVSPVWYQLRREGEDMELLGNDNVDLDWINDVRINGEPLILPRFVLEGWPLDTMLVQSEERKRAINMITSECKSMQYNGLVLEAWSAWVVSRILDNATLRKKALQFISELGAALHKLNLQLFFVIPPPNPAKMDLSQFTPLDMATLRDAVDGFSLMTYDFSSPFRPGPSAPLLWVRACLNLLLPKTSANKMETSEQKMNSSEGGQQAAVNLAKKLLTGINFYGNDFIIPQGGNPIVGHEYLALLRKQKPALEWDDANSEHYFHYQHEGTAHVVYYPSLLYLALRLQEAKTWGVGISIWEIGQGLEYFFDLL